MQTRRNVLSLPALLALTRVAAAFEQDQIFVTALRWDAWYGGTPPSPSWKAQQNIINPEYSWRAPFFYDPPKHQDGSTIMGSAATVMRREVTYAKKSGLDSWNFARHEDTDPFSIPFQVFTKDDLMFKYSLRYSPNRQWHEEVHNGRLLSYIKQPHYERTRDGRPIIYLSLSKPADNAETLVKDIQTLRTQCRAELSRDPYVVCIGFFAVELLARTMMYLGADAIAVYATFGDGAPNEPFSVFDVETRRYWDRMKRLGVPMMPTGSLGYDPRPRLNGHPSHFVQTASAQEVYDHLRALAAWLRANKDACPTQRALLYAWNEFDEGGWLCPTWTPSGPDRTRIDAARAALG